MTYLTPSQKELVANVEGSNRKERRAFAKKYGITIKIPGTTKPYVKEVNPKGKKVR